MPFGDLSAVYRQHLADYLVGTAGYAVLWNVTAAAAYKVALYNDTVTPNKLATAAQSAYGSAAWPAGAEQFDITTGSGNSWPVGGMPLTGVAAVPPAGTNGDQIIFDGDNTPGAGTLTLDGVEGDLVYFAAANAAQVNQGLAYHSFGGAQGVTDGTFSIIWSDEGIMLIEID
jgi:hypothetical protein